MKTADRKPSRIMPESTAKNISAKKYLPASTAKPTHQPSPVGKTHACSKAVSAFWKCHRAYAIDCRLFYVEADRVQIWAKAYHYYFNGDIIIASHLLMPQFEHTLHNLLEEIVGDVTKLNQNIQNEPTLIGILKQLEPYCNPTLYDELSIFLVDSNDVNYRNRLMHGLMWSMDMLRYGHYLFYLSNMLYFKGKDFLKIGEHQDENENNY